VLSAYFILAANSWMQRPVGAVLSGATHRAELRDFGAVLTNSTAIGAFTHTMTALQARELSPRRTTRGTR
jgi:cytochrome d ubiquinol oxidase subunit I